MKLSTILALALATCTTLATAQQNDFRPKNADEAEKLTEDFKKLTADSPCQDGEQACVEDKFAQCVGGKFQLTPCASGLKCTVLPLVNKPGTSITCDTEADRQARLADARGEKPKLKRRQSDSQDPKVFRPKNADEAEKLTEDFKKLTADSPCQDGEQACVEDEFAQCVGGKFQLTPCASGLKCTVLPLVNKPGTSITCDTEADRQARLADARGEKPKLKRRQGDSQDPKVFRPKNADEAEKLTEDFKKLTADSPCQDGEQACVEDKFAQCVGGKFQLTPCASGLKCTVLPLVNKPGTSITCDTEADRQARLADARSVLRRRSIRPRQNSGTLSTRPRKLTKRQKNAGPVQQMQDALATATPSTPQPTEV